MFKLLKLAIINHSYFGDISLNSVNDEEEHFGPYTTLGVGPNETGKSQILAAIIEILNYLSAFKVRDSSIINLNTAMIFCINLAKIKFEYTIQKEKQKHRKIKNPLKLKLFQFHLKFLPLQ